MEVLVSRAGANVDQRPTLCGIGSRAARGITQTGGGIVRGAGACKSLSGEPTGPGSVNLTGMGISQRADKWAVPP